MQQPYILLTQERYSLLLACIADYQEMHAQARTDWQKQNHKPCECQACKMSNKANFFRGQTIAPIFMAPDTPWAETNEP